MTNARTTQQIVDDGARPGAAEQQAQLEAWGAARGIDWVRPETVFAAITADEVDAYAADGFMSAHPELPQREPGAAGQRLRAIAAIHALADWYALHPDVPSPTYVTAGSTAATDAELAGFASLLGSKVYAHGSQTHVDVVPHSGRGECWAQVVISVPRVDRPL